LSAPVFARTEIRQRLPALVWKILLLHGAQTRLVQNAPVSPPPGRVRSRPESSGGTTISVAIIGAAIDFTREICPVSSPGDLHAIGGKLPSTGFSYDANGNLLQKIVVGQELTSVTSSGRPPFTAMSRMPERDELHLIPTGSGVSPLAINGAAPRVAMRRVAR
jgi:hypothetical protein